MITQQRLKELLRYSKRTGIFYWRVNKARTAKAGMPAGSVNTCGYIQIKLDGNSYMASRLAWLYVTGAWPSIEMDHKNLKPADNRWCNLREATRSQNMANIRRNRLNTSGVKGISLVGGRWLVQLRNKEGSRFVGRFRIKKEAVRARQSAAKAKHGEFVRL